MKPGKENQRGTNLPLGCTDQPRKKKESKTQEIQSQSLIPTKKNQEGRIVHPGPEIRGGTKLLNFWPADKKERRSRLELTTTRTEKKKDEAKQAEKKQASSPLKSLSRIEKEERRDSGWPYKPRTNQPARREQRRDTGDLKAFEEIKFLNSSGKEELTGGKTLGLKMFQVQKLMRPCIGETKETEVEKNWEDRRGEERTWQNAKSLTEKTPPKKVRDLRRDVPPGTLRRRSEGRRHKTLVKTEPGPARKGKKRGIELI